MGGSGGRGERWGRVLFPSGFMKIHHIKQCRAWRAGKARVQAVLRCAGGGSIDFMAVELVRSWLTTSLETAPVFSLLFSFVSPDNSTPRVTSPSGENQEATRKLRTISSFFSPKELQEEVLGRKDAKADKNLRGSWKYSGEHGDGRRSGP